MKPIAKVIVGIIAFSGVVGVATCTRIVSRYAQAFETTNNGEPVAMIISRFGAPSVREVPAHPFLTYAAAGCKAPCSVRLWWEHPVLKGIEALRRGQWTLTTKTKSFIKRTGCRLEANVQHVTPQDAQKTARL